MRDKDTWPDIPDAVYNEQPLPEYAENLFICALPPIKDPLEVINDLRILPRFDENEINLPPHLRVHALQRLTTQFFQPFAQHLMLEARFALLIRQGYLGRNPGSVEEKHLFNNNYDNVRAKAFSLTPRKSIASTASSFAIVGTSGCGKTFAIKHILSKYTPAMYHPKLHRIQIPYLILECPSHGSVKVLCRNFFTAVDNLAGTEYIHRHVKSRTGTDDLIAAMSQVASTHGLGVLVIDEIQKLSIHRSGGDEKMMNFFVTLVNMIGIPVVMVGTPKAERLFEEDFSLARRSSGLGMVAWDQMPEDSNWNALLELLWNYQWLKNKVPLTADIRNVLYECSQGVIDILLKLFVLSQWRAMLTKTEALSEALIRRVYQQELKAVHPMLAALRSKDRQQIERFSDLRVTGVEDRMIQTAMKSVSVVITQPASIEQSIEIEDKINKIKELARELGIHDDIAEPMIRAEIAQDPSVSVMHVIHRMTTLMTTGALPSSKKPSKRPQVNNWREFEADDLRYSYAHKEDQTMYQCLRERGVVCSVVQIIRDS